MKRTQPSLRKGTLRSPGHLRYNIYLMFEEETKACVREPWQGDGLRWCLGWGVELMIDREAGLKAPSWSRSHPTGRALHGCECPCNYRHQWCRGKIANEVYSWGVMIPDPSPIALLANTQPLSIILPILSRCVILYLSCMSTNSLSSGSQGHNQICYGWIVSSSCYTRLVEDLVISA